MIAITHTGKIGDFGQCLPICSWLYKTYNEKIIFVIPRGFPFFKDIESLIRLQPFTEDVIYCDFTIQHFDLGGQPYQFDPRDFIPDLNISRYHNFGFRSKPDKFVTEFYAEEHGLGIDKDFVLNLGLTFNSNSNKLMCSEVMAEFFPGFEQPDFTKDFLTNLQELAYAKERHLHFSSLAVFLSLAKIPFYLYTIAKYQPFVDLIEYSKYVTIEPSEFWLFYKTAPVLDVRSVTEDKKIISVYNEVYFK